MLQAFGKLDVDDHPCASSVQHDHRSSVRLLEILLVGILAHGVAADDHQLAIVTPDQDEPHIAAAIPRLALEGVRDLLCLNLIHLFSP